VPLVLRLVPRIEREDVLRRVAGHTLVYPIRHAARVRLPQAELRL
jgi:hypothetical protein